jgi:hypothetical protein
VQLSKGVNETPYLSARKKPRQQRDDNETPEQSSPTCNNTPAATAKANTADNSNNGFDTAITAPANELHSTPASNDTRHQPSPCKRVRFQEPESNEPATSPRRAYPPPTGEETATALVSTCTGDMLVAKALLAGELTVTHFDSCATHCFVSKRMSAHLTSKGYPPKQSSTRFNVMQGNPLCSTSQVHHEPLCLVREDGSICAWDDCLFLVADAGAPVILCYTLLRLGGIIRYEPPTGYEELLLRPASNPSQWQRGSERGCTSPSAELWQGQPANPWYRPPAIYTKQKTSTVFHTAAGLKEPARKIFVAEFSVLTSDLEAPLLCGALPEHFEKFSETQKHSEADPQVQGGTAHNCQPDTGAAVTMKTAVKAASPGAEQKKKKRGVTEMLTAADPYGKNPPLPDEVMEAVKHLKMPADPTTSSPYTPQQLADMRSEFLFGRPAWANCLTVDKTVEVSDK